MRNGIAVQKMLLFILMCMLLEYRKLVLPFSTHCFCLLHNLSPLHAQKSIVHRNFWAKHQARKRDISQGFLAATHLN